MAMIGYICRNNTSVMSMDMKESESSLKPSYCTVSWLVQTVYVKTISIFISVIKLELPKNTCLLAVLATTFFAHIKKDDESS